ncbi:SAM-dependent methyltransferase [Micromonospora sp. SH-82]|uniref:SAM-dependent methyltransferase n=1 Tax=Micromonospora sp. SH-82 TaxID=3132938 RepID=UPI003EC0E26C
MGEPEQPSTARMIDFWLGGRHHFPVDVAAAGAFEGAYGPCRPVFRSLRSFLGRAVRSMAAQGLDGFLVFGGGVPTCGNVHEVAGGASVLYTDVDPVTVRSGQEILAGCDRAGYGFGDAADVGTVDPAQLHRFVPGWGRRPVGVVFLGVAAFLDDETVAATLDELYAVSAPGSRLAVDFDGMDLAGYPQALAMMGPAYRMREPARMRGLLGRWEPTVEGIVPVARWRPQGPVEAVADAFYGGVAVRGG